MMRQKVNTVFILGLLCCIAVSAMFLFNFAARCYGQRADRRLPVKIVQLAEAEMKGSSSLEEVLAGRRSVHQFSGRQLSSAQIGQLAWAGQGITEKQRGFRTAPSAGAIYPMELYFATKNGLFLYKPNQHSLEQILDKDLRADLSAAALGQQAVGQAACDIIVAGAARKLAVKYRDKARRYMLLEAGHIAQNILLQSVSLQLGAVPIGAFDIARVGRICRLPRSLEPLYIICVGYPASQAVPEENRQKEVSQMVEQEHKKAVLIIAGRNFRDEELFETKNALEQTGVETTVASIKTGVIKGMLGRIAEAAITINDIDVDDYDALVFIGGSGARQYFNNEAALEIARQAKAKNKVLAAICIAPTVLANAGVLGGVKATSFPSEKQKLKEHGAKYTGSDVEQDGLIITASGPKAAGEFGKTIAKTLASK
ncbi:MAG: DJ-1/PfpI family protein [Sedimentisphaerales bacterium]|nr:DJ-1/PfpI family protein [Sedimentisphaerales bacterium]